MTNWPKILHDVRVWPGEFFDVLSLEKSLHYGPKFNFLWKLSISDFHEIAVLSIWTLCGFVVHETWPFRNHQKVHGVSLHLGDFWTSPELPLLSCSGRNYKITSQPNSDTMWTRFSAGNPIGGLIYSQILNLKTA